MARNWWSKISCVLTFYIICVGLCQDQCQQRCWKGMPDHQVLGATQVPNVTSENDCKDLCANNGTCFGIDWDTRQGISNFGCWFRMTPTNAYVYAYSGVNHWDLVNCSDDCLSYCWKPLKEDIGFYGSQRQEVMDENHCKLLCSQTSCTGVDWITNENTCWLINLSSGPFAARLGFHHWDIVKNIPTNCQPITGSTTTSATSTRPISVESQVSASPLSDVPSTTGKEESLRAAVIALAVLSGFFLVIIIALVVVVFRIARLLRDQSSSSNVKEPEQPYDGLQLDNRSPAPVYTDLQPIN